LALATLAGMSKYEFDATVVTDDGGPDPELLKRFAVCMTYRLELLDERDNAYPAVGDSSYFLDSFEGKFAWELSGEELESNPPTGVYCDIEHVDPAEPAGSGRVTVTARIPVENGPASDRRGDNTTKARSELTGPSWCLARDDGCGDRI